jgi:hypothetical protein
MLMNTLLTRSILLMLSVISLTLSGCTFPPTIASESALGVTPRKFESVVLVVNPGVFDDLRTFGKVHIEHLGDVVEEELKSRGLRTSVVLSRLTDLQHSAFQQAVWRLKPTHIVRIIPTKRTTSTNLDRVTWLVQVDQQEPGKAGYIPGFKFTISGDGCVKRPPWSTLEEERRCFRELSAPIFSALDKSGFGPQTAIAVTGDQALTSKDSDLVRAAIERGDIPWLKKPDAQVSANGTR